MKRCIPLFFAAILCMPAAVQAQSVQSAQGRFLRGLGLDDNQIGQILNLESTTRDDVRQKRAQLKVVRAQINLAMVAPSVDLNRVNELIDQVSQLRAQIAKTLAAVEVRIRAIVGDSTFAILKERLRAHWRVLREERLMERRGLQPDRWNIAPPVLDGVLQ